MAHHYAEAGLIEEAIESYLAAAQSATARSNNTEATRHLAKSLRLLNLLPTSARRTVDLRMQIMKRGWFL